MVEDRALSQKTPLCVDGRLRAASATGVASYARAVMLSLASVGREPLMLDDATRGRFGERSAAAQRLRRFVEAGSGRGRPLVRTPEGFFANDVFRLAQARFDRTGRLLRLNAPGPPGIMHWTYPIPARIEGWVNVYTIHDVVPLTHAGMSPIAPTLLRNRLRAIARSGDPIVTVSETSRAAICETLRLPAERVTNCGAAVVDLDPRATLPEGLTRGGYHLYCGSDEARKNLVRIAAAWRRSGVTRPLVLAGPHRGTLPPEVISVGYLPRPQLMALIAGARALLFPTLEEGLGLPVIEAMAVGTPVLTSNRGALAETAGDAALLVDPEDIAAMATEIAAIDAEPELRRELRARGHTRALAFSAEAFGMRLLEAYAQFAGESRDGF